MRILVCRRLRNHFVVVVSFLLCVFARDFTTFFLVISSKRFRARKGGIEWKNPPRI